MFKKSLKKYKEYWELKSEISDLKRKVNALLILNEVWECENCHNFVDAKDPKFVVKFNWNKNRLIVCQECFKLGKKDNQMTFIMSNFEEKDV